MANLLYANNAVGTLASGITNVATSLTLNAGQAALFPNPSAPQVFYVTLTDAATQTLIEIVQVTAVSGNIFSIVRAQDGTTALSWNAGDIVSQRTIRLELQGFENAAEGLFGSTGQNVIISPSTTLGIKGTTLADNANAGSVGEYLLISQNPIATLSGSGAQAVVTALVLTPGDWDVSGDISWQMTAAVTTVTGGIGTTGGEEAGKQTVLPASGQTFMSAPYPTCRYSVAANTTVTLYASAFFSGGGGAVAGGSIRARRVR
jgi:hypothetical protein